MASAQFVETSVNVTSNSPSQGYGHLDDHNLRAYEGRYCYQKDRTIQRNIGALVVESHLFRKSVERLYLLCRSIAFSTEKSNKPFSVLLKNLIHNKVSYMITSLCAKIGIIWSNFDFKVKTHLRLSCINPSI